jgi:5'-nucleotidase
MTELGHTVTVVAPDRERSGAGHSITTTSLNIHRVFFSEYDACVRIFQSSGTPADCAMLGLAIAAPNAELLISGINEGPNLGCDVFYSGTVAAAREGYFYNRLAISISLALRQDERKRHYETAVRVIENLTANLSTLFKENEPALLNVNVPNLPLAEIKGSRAAFAGRRRYRNRFQTCDTPGEEGCYRLHGEPVDEEELEGSDVKTVNNGYIALTFLRHDTTDYERNAVLGAQIADKIFRSCLK